MGARGRLIGELPEMAPGRDLARQAGSACSWERSAGDAGRKEKGEMRCGADTW